MRYIEDDSSAHEFWPDQKTHEFWPNGQNSCGCTTDGEGRGATLYLARDTVQFVKTWLEVGGIDGGHLFRSVRKDATVGEKLDASQVPRIYDRYGGGSGLRPPAAPPPTVVCRRRRRGRKSRGPP